jgi:hypothetical protein
MSQRCYRGFTEELQTCYSGVAVRLRYCYSGGAEAYDLVHDGFGVTEDRDCDCNVMSCNVTTLKPLVLGLYLSV